MTAYERLSAMDCSFLDFENRQTHMHVGGVMILEPGAVTSPAGAVDIELIRDHLNARLRWIPRYRQRLAFAPLTGQPVWVDYERLNLRYHVRHTRVPLPGDERQLKRLTARILSQPLDRAKPLWELWVVEGLQDGSWALVTKTHHCMVDGVAGVELLSAMMSTDPNEVTPDRAEPWIPRPVPEPWELLGDEIGRRVRNPLRLLQRAAAQLRDPQAMRADLGQAAAALARMGREGLRGATPTPLNQPVGPYRRFDWLQLDLAEVKEVKNALGGTVNDVVLATVAGAVRHFLARRGVRVDDLDFRVTVPVNRRADEERSAAGNKVSAWMVGLPIGERDPARRLYMVQRATAALKSSQEARGPELLMQLADLAGPAFVRLGVRLTSRLNPYNMIVTNVPGPPIPLYLLGARMREGFPMVPLFDNQALGIALFSYVGRLCWGFNADWDLVPDLHAFVEDIETSFRELLRVARGEHRRRVSRPRRSAVRHRAAGRR